MYISLPIPVGSSTAGSTSRLYGLHNSSVAVRLPTTHEAILTYISLRPQQQSVVVSCRNGGEPAMHRRARGRRQSMPRRLCQTRVVVVVVVVAGRPWPKYLMVRIISGAITRCNYQEFWTGVFSLAYPPPSPLLLVLLRLVAGNQ